MTANALLSALLPLMDDLSRDLPQAERYRRLLQALRELVPCDAAALLELDGDVLVPLAVDGLSTDTLGRRFQVSAHPRLAVLLECREPTHFPSDCELPDPYDGLIESADPRLEVHDCMGCPVFIDDTAWGLLTLDALSPSRFDRHDVANLAAFAQLAGATVKAAQRMQSLRLRAQEEHRLADTYRQAAGQRSAPTLIGQSAAHKALLKEIALVAESDLTVLIGGETGTGKELVAQAIHAASPRSSKPLITVNCAALPDALVESELFGHTRGAFSGAIAERRGKFELADGGTLFLDEVGELPAAAQAKLLRVLQSGQLQRLGSDREHRADVRVLAATNRDLAEEVRAGRFRADLYHRLSVYPLVVPPLRERGRDVLLLAGCFLEQNRPRFRLRGLRLAADAQAALLAHSWPGNVRELEHLMGRAALKAQSRNVERSRVLTIVLADLDLPEQTGASAVCREHVDTQAARVAGLRAQVDMWQRQLIEESLGRHGGVLAQAAKELQIDRANLHRLAKRLGVEVGSAAGHTRTSSSAKATVRWAS